MLKNKNRIFFTLYDFIKKKIIATVILPLPLSSGKKRWSYLFNYTLDCLCMRTQQPIGPDIQIDQSDLYEN